MLPIGLGCLDYGLNNDRYKDLFVANGIFGTCWIQDYINFMADPEARSERSCNGRKGDQNSWLTPYLRTAFPIMRFENIGSHFPQPGDALGFWDSPSFSSGSTYGDLDNDKTWIWW